MKGEEPARKYRCAKCGYITQRAAPPKDCPICGAGSEAFDDIGVDRSPRIRAIDTNRS